MEKEIEKRFYWRDTGRTWTNTELNIWRQRIRYADWDSTDECQDNRDDVVGVFDGGHDLGWANPRNRNRGGTHFWLGNEDWIVITPKGYRGRDNEDVLTSMLHEAAHHLAGYEAGHGAAWQDIVDCVLSFSGA